MRVRLASVLASVCRTYGVSGDDITGTGRDPRVVLARHLVIWLSVNKCDRDPKWVGHRIGGREHATVLHACRSIEGHLLGSEEFEAKVNRIWAQAVDIERHWLKKWSTPVKVVNGVLEKVG